jgi:uncharacterized DUF497 family protein
MEIEWDPAKAASNLKKHGIRFSDVEPAFYDVHALSMADPFSVGEERFVLVGTDAVGRILAVSFTYRGENVRLISARRATASERSEYEKGIRL